MNYRSAIKGFIRYLKCTTMLTGFSFMIVSPLWAETPTQRFLINQATVTYTQSKQTIVTNSNESVVPITSVPVISQTLISQTETSPDNIDFKSLLFNGLSPKIESLLQIEAKPQRFLINQATVTYTQSEKAVVANSNESAVPIISPAEIKLKTRNSPKAGALPEGISASL